MKLHSDDRPFGPARIYFWCD